MKNICFQMTRKAFLAVVMLLMAAMPALAQKITVKGTVYTTPKANQPSAPALK